MTFNKSHLCVMYGCQGALYNHQNFSSGEGAGARSKGTGWQLSSFFAPLLAPPVL